MTRTNLSRCSKLVVALLVFAALAVPAGAASVADEDVPDEAAVGSEVTATVTLEELYRNPSYESWTLTGQTELTDVTWTVEYYDQTGSKAGQESVDGQNITSGTIAADDGVSEVRVRVTGTVPEIESYRYDPPQQFLLLSLTQAREGGTSNGIGEWNSHHYTAESDEARTALDEADAAVEGADAPAAEEKLQQAVDAYESENFDLAVELATEAQEQAESAEQSRQTRRLLLYGAGGLVVLGLLVGGVLYWRSQQDSRDKLA
jgi:hypothetical protein